MYFQLTFPLLQFSTFLLSLASSHKIAGGDVQNERYSAAFRSLETHDPVANRWDILPSLPGAVHGIAVPLIGNKLHTVSGKMEGGGFADAPGKATADHNVMEMHAAGTQ